MRKETSARGTPILNNKKMQFLTEGEKLMKKAKIMIESHGVSPWHDYLQNMSWGFSRGSAQDADGISYLDVDGKLEDGGQGLKYVLMADFLDQL